MEICFKGIEQIEGFISDLHNRLDAKLEDLPCIISQMGISGEHIEVEFTECLSDKDIFVVSIMDDILNPKAYRCAMLIGSMINPYPGFSCDDGKTVKYYSWDGKVLELIHQYPKEKVSMDKKAFPYPYRANRSKNPFEPEEHSFLPHGPTILNSKDYVDEKGRRCAEGGSFFNVKLKKKEYFDQ